MPEAKLITIPRLPFNVPKRVPATRSNSSSSSTTWVAMFRTCKPTPKREVDITDEGFGQTLLQTIQSSPDQAGDMWEAFKVVVRDDRVLQLQPHSITDINYGNPDLRRDLVKLQLLGSPRRKLFR